jgi:hypothetical protein
MWKRLRRALWRLWQRSQRSPSQRRAAEARARFWAEVREGQREAEVQSRSWADGSKRTVSALGVANIEAQRVNGASHP